MGVLPALDWKLEWLEPLGGDSERHSGIPLPEMPSERRNYRNVSRVSYFMTNSYNLNTSLIPFKLIIYWKNSIFRNKSILETQFDILLPRSY